MTCGTAVLYYVADDELPDLSFELDTDLSSFDSIKLRVRYADGTKITKDAVIDDSDNGRFHFEWSTGELFAGIHNCEVIFYEDTTLRPMTVPDRIPIRLVVRERA